MSAWRNTTGRALSSPSWLDAHHRAKLAERRRFAQRLADYSPRQVVDLGCGPGLWLDLLDEFLPADCKFIGVDSDDESVSAASARSQQWGRESEFIVCDVENEPEAVPGGDLVLAFNLFPYVSNMPHLLDCLHDQDETQRVVVRQYDGDLIRIGPMSASDRELLNASLYSSLQSSAGFGHYELDRAYETVVGSGFDLEDLQFEQIERHSPFPEDFSDYFEGTIAWMMSHLSTAGRELLDRFMSERVDGLKPVYVVQTDLVAVLSARS